MKLLATLLCDGYKTGHPFQYPKNTEYVYSTWTPRSTKYLDNTEEIVFYGLQGFIKEWLIDYFNNNFFNLPKEEVINTYVRFMKSYLGNQEVITQHIEDLHDLGYLPILIKALPEGTISKPRIPQCTVVNTHPNFGWVTNSIETLWSLNMWHPSTVATIALSYRKLFEKYAMETVGNVDFVKFQGHDFSMRGMSGIDSVKAAGSAWLTSFVGTDTIPAIFYHEEMYNSDITKELVGCSVYATEHSVQCAGGKEDEYETYRRLIEDVYPSGIVSIVSDTWDLWHVLTVIIPALKDKILARDGKVVCRPDSGSPADIICGTNSDIKIIENENDLHDYFYDLDEEKESRFIYDGICYIVNGSFTINDFIRDYGSDARFDWKDLAEACYKYGYIEVDKFNNPNSPAAKGVIELLWDIFGGTVNSKGYKELDPHIGAIYGDSITLDIAEDICKRLKKKGFASTNLVMGVGSFQLIGKLSRDSLGFAVKSTSVTINGEERAIFKDPITDDGTKKSACGRCVVLGSPFNDNSMRLVDGLDSKKEEIASNIDMLKLVFKDGKLLKETSLSEIRNRLGFF